MAATAESLGKNCRLGLRVSHWQRTVLLDASRAEGTTVSDFVLKHATRAAEQVLADRRLFRISPERWDAFVDALDRPERDLPKLRALLNEPTVLD